MAAPTRYNLLGMSGKASVLSDGNEFNRGDYGETNTAFAVKAVQSGAAQDTGIPTAEGVGVVAFVDIKTAEVTGTTKTLDVGFSGGSGDELIQAANVAATGVIPGNVNIKVAAGQTLTFTLGSADFQELDCDVVIKFIGATREA